ncbi:hypothetical protein WH47_05510 [Habropoda laboriosa]|uniref:Uncharacterized protein n=1 Tax=Habropoda laboriosa TaxID=597456 RepID=A0A0L7RF04_9HYME|nr:hypothetical protein WH47_05510 [Habropoda laboriosa]
MFVWMTVERFLAGSIPGFFSFSLLLFRCAVVRAECLSSWGFWIERWNVYLDDGGAIFGGFYTTFLLSDDCKSSCPI